MNIIDTKWVFTCKYDENSQLQAKVRLVARGFKDQNNYLSFEIYAPVAPLTAIRWILSVSHKFGLRLMKMDV